MKKFFALSFLLLPALVRAELSPFIPVVPVGEAVSSWAAQGEAGCAGGRETYYPGARGFAACTQGGFVSGTTVYHVTNLNTSGAGSLNNALDQSCPKVIVFDVSGTIDYNVSTETPLSSCDNWSLVGETAPSPGIVMRDVEFRVRTGSSGNDVAISHITVGGGDEGGVDRDSIQVEGNSVFVANITAQWGVDENVHCYPGATRTGMSFWQVAIINPLDDSIHTEGVHGYGYISDQFCVDVDFNRVVFANMRGRSPFSAMPTMHQTNTVLYNTGEYNNNVLLRNLNSTATNTNVVNNLFIYGPNTVTTNDPIRGESNYGNGSLLYENGNSAPDWENCASNGCVTGLTAGELSADEISAAKPSGVVPQAFTRDNDSEEQAFLSKILDHAGSRPTNRLAHLQGVFDDIETGYTTHTAGGIVDTVAGDGGWPTLAENTVDHSDTGHAACGLAIPTTNKDDVMSSGLTRLHETIICCHTDAVMPSGWRPDTLQLCSAP
jgi:hypothetical protein